MNKHYLSFYQLNALGELLAHEIKERMLASPVPILTTKKLRVFGVPRGGVGAALLLGQFLRINIVEDAASADIIVDDLIDSGKTAMRYARDFPEKPFFALLDKRCSDWKGKWVVFPWEGTSEGSFEDNVVRLLQFIGEDPGRGGLLETPKRVALAWQDWCSGYDEKPEDVLKVFTDGAEKHDQMISVEDIPFYSHCEHHLAAFFGTVTISYVPDGHIVGLSKLSRLADIYAKRLQVQERMTDQIADALHNHLHARGVGVCVKARHLCMESRGISQQGHRTVTTALRGVIKEDPRARGEFLQLAR